MNYIFTILSFFLVTTFHFCQAAHWNPAAEEHVLGPTDEEHVLGPEAGPYEGWRKTIFFHDIDRPVRSLACDDGHEHRVFVVNDHNALLFEEGREPLNIYNLRLDDLNQNPAQMERDLHYITEDFKTAVIGNRLYLVSGGVIGYLEIGSVLPTNLHLLPGFQRQAQSANKMHIGAIAGHSNFLYLLCEDLFVGNPGILKVDPRTGERRDRTAFPEGFDFLSMFQDSHGDLHIIGRGQEEHFMRERPRRARFVKVVFDLDRHEVKNRQEFTVELTPDDRGRLEEIRSITLDTDRNVLLIPKARGLYWHRIDTGEEGHFRGFISDPEGMTFVTKCIYSRAQNCFYVITTTPTGHRMIRIAPPGHSTKPASHKPVELPGLTPLFPGGHQ